MKKRSEVWSLNPSASVLLSLTSFLLPGFPPLTFWICWRVQWFGFYVFYTCIFYDSEREHSAFFSSHTLLTEMRTGLPECHISCTITEVCIYCVKMLIKKYDEGGVLVFWAEGGVDLTPAPLGRDQEKSINILWLQLPEQNQKQFLWGEAAPAEGLLWFFFFCLDMHTEGKDCFPGPFSSSCVKIYLCSNPEGMVAAQCESPSGSSRLWVSFLNCVCQTAGRSARRSDRTCSPGSEDTADARWAWMSEWVIKGTPLFTCWEFSSGKCGDSSTGEEADLTTSSCFLPWSSNCTSFHQQNRIYNLCIITKFTAYLEGFEF